MVLIESLAAGEYGEGVETEVLEGLELGELLQYNSTHAQPIKYKV